MSYTIRMMPKKGINPRVLRIYRPPLEGYGPSTEGESGLRSRHKEHLTWNADDQLQPEVCGPAAVLGQPKHMCRQGRQSLYLPTGS